MGNRASLDGLIFAIRKRSEALKEVAEEITAEFAHQGEKDMEFIIEHAVTETGLRRANGEVRINQRTGEVRTGSEPNQSVSPGRIDSALMINSVNSLNETNDLVFTGTFGWTGEFEKYFLEQENGTIVNGRVKIEAMNALHGSFVQNRERALARVHEAVRGETL